MGSKDSQVSPRHPYKLPFPGDAKLTQVSCGDMFTVAVTEGEFKEKVQVTGIMV